MKTILAIIILSLFWENMNAQAPQSFRYQAVARDNSGNVLTNQAVSFRISILSGSVSGAVAYSETHSGLSTNSFGLVELEIGKGTPGTGTFSTIDWGNNSYFVKIEMDPAGGNSYQELSTSQLLSVPYALHSKTAETATSAVKLTGDQTIEGKKTFTGTITVPNPINANDAVTKSYVDAMKGHYVGEIYGGGVVFFVDNSRQHGLIAEYDFLWAIWSNVQTQIGTTAQSPWDGFSNSLAIYYQPGMTASAAKTCFLHQSWTGMDDWFLPSVGQLNLLYNVSYELNYSLASNINFTEIEGMVWSSTEDGAQGYAKAIDLSTGIVHSYPKSTSLRVRPIRKF